MLKAKNHLIILVTAIFLTLRPSYGQILYERSHSDLFSSIIKLYSEKNKERLKVGLVLSGGGARGITQIGVLRGFEKYNIPIDLNSLASCSGDLKWMVSKPIFCACCMFGSESSMNRHSCAGLSIFSSMIS